MTNPAPHTHPDISKLTQEAQTKLVTEIRERRVRLRRLLEETQRLKEEARERKIAEQITKQLSIFEREITRVDKALEKAVDRGNKIIGLMISIGIDNNDVRRLINILKGEDT